ncbi:intraflagellar transport protein 46 homolog isoform X3 [Sycon ciliatum]|uniref:intraflagellar transport protein 46 homolog isoform X3 n=1 Tax=Sycon ciliatum TaxID=27933 RepID=UPI0031F67B22
MARKESGAEGPSESTGGPGAPPTLASNFSVGAFFRQLDADVNSSEPNKAEAHASSPDAPPDDVHSAPPCPPAPRRLSKLPSLVPEYSGQDPVMYDAAEYNNLPVGEEVKELFKHITQFSPTNVNLQTKLRPFVPEYLPAVGDIDGFVKVERPDGKPEMLGLTVLDEPCAKQSDPTVMDLQLRRMTKEKQAKHVTVHSIPEGSKNTKAIDNWIENITDLHRHKPPPTVNYTGPMPDIESLMKEWPAEYEKSLKDLPLPSADLDCDLAAYVDIACGLLDIPVHKSRIEALHVMFSLYAEFKSSQIALGKLPRRGSILRQAAPGKESGDRAGRSVKEVQAWLKGPKKVSFAESEALPEQSEPSPEQPGSATEQPKPSSEQPESTTDGDNSR